MTRILTPNSVVEVHNVLLYNVVPAEVSSASGPALPAVRRHDVVGKFKYRIGDGVRKASESLAHVLYRAAAGFRRLACNKTSSVAFFKHAKEGHFRFDNLYLRFFLHQCNYLRINCKYTEFPPVIQYIKH